MVLVQFFYIAEDVKSLALPGTYHEKIISLGDALRKFSRLKALDLSRNALETVEVSGKARCSCFIFITEFYRLVSVTLLNF